MNVAKQITVGTLNGVRKGFKGVTEETHVARIYGIARAVEDGEHPQNGPWVRFLGDFKGVNQDGEVTIAPTCFLTSPADGILRAAVVAAEGRDVQFGFDFYVVPHDTAVLGYVYKVKPMMELVASDPMKALEASFGKDLPAIGGTPALRLGSNTDADVAAAEAKAGERDAKGDTPLSDEAGQEAPVKAAKPAAKKTPARKR